MKSLLVSATYFPPQTGGMSRMMEEICIALGPDQVACLTGVRAAQRDSGSLDRIRVYRRPTAFASNKAIQAGALALAFSEILIRDRPDILQLCSCQEGSIGLLAEK